MTEKKKKLVPEKTAKEKKETAQKLKAADRKYNKARREPLFRVEISSADTVEEAEKMRQMKLNIVKHSGSAKQGVIDMYKFCEGNGYFDN